MHLVYKVVLLVMYIKAMLSNIYRNNVKKTNKVTCLTSMLYSFSSIAVKS